MRLHAGRYNTRKAAEEWKEVCRKNGDIAIVIPAEVFDVFIIGKVKGHGKQPAGQAPV